MFRPAPEGTLHAVPFRLIASVLLILAFAVSVILLFSLEHEKFVLQGLTDGKTPAADLFPALWQSRRDLITITVLLFLVSAIGIAAVITFIHYRNTRRTLEQVKGLARNILQSIPTGVLTVNRSGLITAVNPMAETVFKRSSRDLLGYMYDSVFGEGHTIRVVLDRALGSGQHVDHTDLPYDRDEETRMIRVSTADLAEEDDQPGGVILQAQDVTEWLRLEQRVRIAEKLAALHTLSAGVAHELRNPLGAMDLNLHLLGEELRHDRALPAQAAHYLQIINAECRRLSVILDNFMKFARPSAIQLHPVDIKGLVAHITALLRYEAEERKIRLETVVADGLPAVIVDETQIGQVLVNIMVNAFHAMPDGGTCRISAVGRWTDSQEWVELSVQDSGVGIKKEDLSRLFEPFYTTKAGGTGLGLAIAYRIIRDHSGTIQVESVLGTGTTVVIKIPTGRINRQALAAGS